MVALIATLSSTEAAPPIVPPIAPQLAPVSEQVATTTTAAEPTRDSAPESPKQTEEGFFSKVTVALGGELFARARATRESGGDFEKSYALNRARLSLTLRYQDVLRLTLEPDFSSALCQSGGALCDDAEISDAFADVSPNDTFDARIGQAKTPYGVLETTSAWRLPAHRRGLVSDLVEERLRFGGRKLGIKTRVRLRELPLKPSIELGAYTDVDRAFDEDFALRAILKPWKGGEVQLQGYVERDATTAGDAAPAGALAVLHDKGAIYAAIEAQLGRARLLTLTGDAGLDSTFFAFRALAAYSFALDRQKRFELAPFAGFDAFDPNIATQDDVGFEVRGGLNFYFMRMFRASIEVDRRTAQRAFPAPARTVVSFLFGASLE